MLWQMVKGDSGAQRGINLARGRKDFQAATAAAVEREVNFHLESLATPASPSRSARQESGGGRFCYAPSDGRVRRQLRGQSTAGLAGSHKRGGSSWRLAPIFARLAEQYFQLPAREEVAAVTHLLQPPPHGSLQDFH